jgi:hypothetical protein
MITEANFCGSERAECVTVSIRSEWRPVAESFRSARR